MNKKIKGLQKQVEHLSAEVENLEFRRIDNLNDIEYYIDGVGDRLSLLEKKVRILEDEADDVTEKLNDVINNGTVNNEEIVEMEEVNPPKDKPKVKIEPLQLFKRGLDVRQYVDIGYSDEDLDRIYKLYEIDEYELKRIISIYLSIRLRPDRLPEYIEVEVIEDAD